MALRPIHDPDSGTLRVVGLMSGSGSNLRKIIEHQEKLRQQEGRYLFSMVTIFSDNASSQAVEIGKDYDLPVIVHDIGAFYRKRGAPRSDLKLREQFDKLTVEMLSLFKAEVVAFGGYMSLATKVLIDAFVGVNVHPADLSVVQGGKRKWTGGHAVLDQIAAGEKFLAATTHLIEPACDMGRIFMVSKPLGVEIPAGLDPKNPEELKKISDRNQERLKQNGDWIIFPRTIEEIARGHFQRDETGAFYHQGKPIPTGLRLETI
jgi:folate-dependent phosphoribosylglycinamide formyltransferase PurN